MIACQLGTNTVKLSLETLTVLPTCVMGGSPAMIELVSACAYTVQANEGPLALSPVFN